MGAVELEKVEVSPEEMAIKNMFRFRDAPSDAARTRVFTRSKHPVDIELVSPAVGDGETLTPEEDYCCVIAVEGQPTLALNTGEAFALERFDSVVLMPHQNATLINDTQASRCLVCYYYSPTPRDEVPNARPARFRKLQPMRERWPMKWVPQAFRAVLSPRDLFLLIGPKAARVRYALKGPDHLLVTLVSTPVNTGPALHVHRSTTEIFIALEGTYEITWGDDGEHAVTLEPFDAIALPPGLNRTFQNVGGDHNWLMPIVVGANDELDDIVWLPAVAQELSQKVSSFWYWIAKTWVLRFGKRVER